MQAQGNKRAAETPLVSQVQGAHDTNALLQEDKFGSLMDFRSGAKIEIQVVLSNAINPCTLNVPGEFTRYIHGSQKSKCMVHLLHGATNITVAISDVRSCVDKFDPEALADDAQTQPKAKADDFSIEHKSLCLTQAELDATMTDALLFVDPNRGNDKIAS